MQKALAIVVILGAAIGFLTPSGRRPPPAPQAPQPAPVAAHHAAVPAPHSGETVLHRSPLGHFYVDAEVNNDLVHFVVDTGATTVALTVDDARRLNIPFSESDFTLVGRGASGDVRGLPVTLDRIAIDGKEVRGVRGAIIEGLDVSLLGQSYLTRLGSIEMSGDEMRLQ
ncbi:MAG TPA: TIGR02281 family clan AA aspartic protease [Allosphingosinicella sp.]|jgi:aspartyl protease family protein